MKANAQAQIEIKSPIGTLYLCASPNGITSLSSRKSVESFESISSIDPKTKKHLANAKRFLESYFAQKKPNYKDLCFDLKGTKFQKKVWQALLEIPYGQTSSYKEIAEKINSPKAFRAVGSANGANPVFVMVPCHRVIAANRTIGGYSGGLKTKRFLLRLEGVDC